MKSLILFLLLAAVSNIAYSQYYFSDILISRQTNKQYLLLKANHIQQVSAKSFEAGDEPTEDFILEQNISKNSNVITTTSGYPSTGKSISTSVYVNDKISKTTNSSDNINSTTTYLYDNDGNIISLNTITEDTFMHNSSQEVHLWQYQNNQPVQMLLIKNNTDTTVIDFAKDEQGNIAEEHWKKKGRQIETYFYYYNNQQQLTDVVRFNLKAQRLLPDYLFEYDDNGTLTQLTQVPQGSADYLVWKYSYLPNGLKQNELLFNKQRQPVGRIEYSYR